MASGVGVRRLGIAGLGAAVFFFVHGVLELGWQRLFQPAALERAWFMASKSALVTTQVALGTVAMLTALRSPGRWRAWLRDSALLAVGALGAVVALFVAIGPSELMVGPVRLWPVSLAAALLLLGPAVLAGTLLGGFLRGGAIKPVHGSQSNGADPREK